MRMLDVIDCRVQDTGDQCLILRYRVFLDRFVFVLMSGVGKLDRISPYLRFINKWQYVSQIDIVSCGPS